ncbi:sensor histidine kinase [Chitinophaga sp. sic0106]|uniref:sensor histidine kinase n=1 Tax=Chitinophaga sp. sic0106 TaxID=2854785 RepID=UPI001C4821D6|nr:histidine kinase [Chitinophaga sp. sic0106]MBV7533118.1 histidine kinase [Chitinophaga sp. sic0106]
MRDTFLTNSWKRILIVISAFLLMYLISYLIDPFTPYWENFFQRSWKEIISDWTFTFIGCLIISESSIFISNRLNRQVPWTESPGRRFALEAGLILIVVLVLHTIFSILCILLEDDNMIAGGNMTVEETRGLIQWVLVSVIIAFVIIGINTVNYLIYNWKNASLKATELNQIAMEAELQSLKLQIDPHFVFNNLSVLSELILEDQQIGYEYAENFSRIYRYLLLNSKKNLILLEEELKFLDAYRFLISHRFGEAVSFDINVPESSRQLSLPPLTLQLLVENALKHNKANKKSPLEVRIYTTHDQGLVLTAEATEVAFRERDDLKWQQWQVAVVPGVVWGPVADGIGG